GSTAEADSFAHVCESLRERVAARKAEPFPPPRDSERFAKSPEFSSRQHPITMSAPGDRGPLASCTNATADSLSTPSARFARTSAHPGSLLNKGFADGEGSLRRNFDFSVHWPITCQRDHQAV